MWWCAIAAATGGAAIVHHRFPWVPVPYVLALVLSPFALWRFARWSSGSPRVRWSGTAASLAILVALLPLPWMQAALDDPPGNAWRLDGRLTINGVQVDPPGDWYWLTVGRPPIVAEVVAGWLIPGGHEPTTMTGGRHAARPSVSEPAAAAVGLAAAGWAIDFGVLVEVSEPMADWLPAQAVLTTLNGVDVTSRTVFEQLIVALNDRNTFTTALGASFDFEGAALPYGRVDVIDRPVGGLDVAVGGPLAKTPIGAWYRDLALGSSHGLMVALMSYTYASGEDLAAGRTVAGTGRIRGDGAVGRIGGLRAKAEAAREVGADVLVFPALQADDLRGFAPGEMELIPVDSLEEAVTALRHG